MHICEWKFGISIRISLKFVPKGPIDNKSALVQVMAWCRTGDEPLPEPMLTRFTDAYMRHWGEMSRVVTALVRCAGGWAAPRFETHRSCWWKYMHLFSRLFDIFHVNIYGFAVNCVGSNNKTESVTSMESSEPHLIGENISILDREDFRIWGRVLRDYWCAMVPDGNNWVVISIYVNSFVIWVRSRNCGCLVTWFCYQLIAKPGNKTATVPWPDPYNYMKYSHFGLRDLYI